MIIHDITRLIVLLAEKTSTVIFSLCLFFVLLLDVKVKRCHMASFYLCLAFEA